MSAAVGHEFEENAKSSRQMEKGVISSLGWCWLFGVKPEVATVVITNQKDIIVTGSRYAEFQVVKLDA